MPADTVRAAVVQLLADEDTPRNISRAGEFVQAAAVSGAQVVVLPEKWNWWGPASRTQQGAETLDGPSLSAARAWARELGVFVLAGSVLEAIGDGARAYNTSVLIAPDGRDTALYRKVHLFDVTVDGHEYRESDAVDPGEALAVGDAAGLRLGLSVCYDLRFPELYRSLAVSGATALAVPANFTVPTGAAHWEVLLRARAVENLAFVAAAAQGGLHDNGRRTWGHSLVVDPWGQVLACQPEGEAVVLAELDHASRDQRCTQLPALRHRVL